MKKKRKKKGRQDRDKSPAQTETGKLHLSQEAWVNNMRRSFAAAGKGGVEDLEPAQRLNI